VDAERLTIPRLLHRHAETTPDLRFIVSEHDSLTYRALDEESRRTAAQLIRAGVGKETRVGLLMANGCDWAVIAIAVMRVGAVLVPLSTLMAPRELEASLRVAGVEHVVCARRTRGRDHLEDLASIAPGIAPSDAMLYEPKLPRLRSVIAWDDVADVSRRAERVRARRADQEAMVVAYEALVRPADDMVIIFTSGSRGVPKGVVHTHGGALGAVESSLGPRCIERGDRLYIPMPFFWMGGFGGGLMTVFVAGATLITEAEPHPEQTLRLLERERATLFRGWPDQAAALASHPAFAQTDLSSLKPASLAPVLPSHLRGKPSERPILFGMTETFGPYCADRLDRDLPPGKEGSLGRPFAGVEVRVVDPESGIPVAHGQIGEIQVRGPNIMRAICGRRKEETFTDDGFYGTGDGGRTDADGFLYFAGRLDDMFKVRGASVFPSEVEEALESIAYVQRAFVVDIGDADTRRVGAAVIVDARAAHAADELERDARGLLSSFKVPARWRIADELDDIPRTATGKVDKQRLRDFIESGP
jgi:acyl-CoA synthetase (AMP-forming)/AMP-acid ligase II